MTATTTEPADTEPEPAPEPLAWLPADVAAEFRAWAARERRPGGELYDPGSDHTL